MGILPRSIRVIYHYKNVIPSNFNLILLLTYFCIDQVLSRFQVVLPAVPGTCQCLLLHGTVGQRAPLMMTNSVKCIKLLPDSKQRNDLSGNTNLFAFAGKHFIHRCNSNALMHRPFKQEKVLILTEIIIIEGGYKQTKSDRPIPSRQRSSSFVPVCSINQIPTSNTAIPPVARITQNNFILTKYGIFVKTAQNSCFDTCTYYPSACSFKNVSYR